MDWGDWCRNGLLGWGLQKGRLNDGLPFCIWEQEAGFSPTNIKQQHAVTMRACKSDSEERKRKINGEASDKHVNRDGG